MLKTRRGGQVWLVTQPAHAELAGAMAAHWGNEEFTRPGHYVASADAERQRQEVTLAVAEHDNGWWEWEADPPLSPEDGLPKGLGEVLGDPVAGMERWRLGIPRLARNHPYASLLIGDHAYWLYAAQFDPDPPEEFTHHLQRSRTTYPSDVETAAREFLIDVREMQESFEQRLEADEFWRASLEQRNPHARLLQVLDAFSLALCSAVIAPVEGEAKGFGEDHLVFHDVPRRSWEDRVPIEVKPLGGGRLSIAPYPFDEMPLMVSVAVRVAQPNAWWRQAPWTRKQYEFRLA